MSDERDAFIRAICDQPDEDTARLVFADWLDEHGEAGWAGFIRRQIENARRDDLRSFARTRPAARIEWKHSIGGLALIKPWEHVRADHVNPLVVLTGGGRKANYRLCVGWHRGFPEVVGCTAREWHRNFYHFPGPVTALCLSTPAESAVWGRGPRTAGAGTGRWSRRACPKCRPMRTNWSP